MKLNKAIKILKQKGTGLVLKIKEMDLNYNPEKYFNEVQTYGYVLRYKEGVILPTSFKFYGDGEPYQYIDFMEDVTHDLGSDTSEEDWGYYTFEQIVWKFGGLPLHFGLHDVVHKSTEQRLDIYGVN